VPSEAFTLYAPWHAAPVALHVPALAEVSQTAPRRQSTFVVHAVLQVPDPGSQVYVPQSWSVPGVQPPEVSQVPAPLTESPWHFGAAHCVPLPGYTHPSRFVPSHWAPQEPVPLHAGRPLFGGPFGAASHTPGAFGSPHHSQPLSQTSAQHTPSTQKVERHWDAPAQDAPCVLRGWQRPVESQ
jgi:hypothetical protein